MTTPPAPHAYHNPGAQVAQLYQGNNQIINVQSVGQFARQWTPPAPPTCPFDAVARPRHAAAVSAELAQRGSVAIGSKARAVALQGMAGVGKTTLALLLATQLQARYPDGILWADLGPGVTEPTQVQPILNQWAGYALAPLDQQQRLSLLFEPEAVRALLADHPQLLVILDNVWSLPAIAPLRRALPLGAHLLITTRSRTILRELGGGQVEIDTLSEAEAQELAALRLDWPEAAQAPWVQALLVGVGYHPLALDVTLARLRREGDYPAEWQQTAERLVTAIRQGMGFGELRLDDDDRERHVEAVLADSYQRLEENAQSRWRSLGAFALDAPFTTPLAAAFWHCDAEAARRQLVVFANAALLTRLDEQQWQQHGLLRGYALALAQARGDIQAWAAAHAASYNDAMTRADKAKHHYELLSALPQLRHAMTWALAHDLALAQNLIAHSENLLAAFGFSLEGLTWCEAALMQAQATGDTKLMAHSYISLGNTLSIVANLSGQDRRTRLRQALAAYDEALLLGNLDTFFGSVVQNNRGLLLGELANLPDEDRAARLQQALAAYDKALFLSNLDSWINYGKKATKNSHNGKKATKSSRNGKKTTKNSRIRWSGILARAYNTLGYQYARPHFEHQNLDIDLPLTVLSKLANLPDENRDTRAREALAAYDEALYFYSPDTSPFAYAATQNNRGTILTALANLSDEDRGERLHEALAAYDEALRLCRPDIAPLDYAIIQNNRGLLLRELANLPDEDRGRRLQQTLAAYNEALRFRRPDTAPLAYAATQGNCGLLFQTLAAEPGEDRNQCLRSALDATVTAWGFFIQMQHAPYQQWAIDRLYELRTVCGEDFDALWQTLAIGEPPDWLQAA